MLRPNYFVICDGCGNGEYADGDTKAKAAAYARSIGWQANVKHAYCKTCVQNKNKTFEKQRKKASVSASQSREKRK